MSSFGDFTFKKAIEVNAARDIVNCDEISYDYKQQAYLNIIEYYHENLDNEVLTKYLEKLDIEYLNHANARVMIAYMVDMNMFDKAFQAVKLYGFDEIDSEELYRLADYGVEDSNGFLMRICFPSVSICTNPVRSMSGFWYISSTIIRVTWKNWQVFLRRCVTVSEIFPCWQKIHWHR